MVYDGRLNEGRLGPLKDVRIDPFVSEFDMGLAQPLSRSVRLNGFATCLRLEQVYWDILGRWQRSTVVRSAPSCPMSIARCTCDTAG